MTTARRIMLCAAALALLTTASVTAPRAENSDAQDTATTRDFQVGDDLNPADVHLVTSPGRYGLGADVPGSRYAVAHGKLIRIDPSSFKVLSILRDQSRLLD